MSDNVTTGSHASITFTVTSKQLELVSTDGSRMLHKGKYAIIFTNGAGDNAVASITIG